MANLPESAAWAEGIFQIETDTPALGGVDGPANTQGRQLANRTAYLKQQTDAHQLRLDQSTREVVMRDDQGLVHHMVWVPRFRVAANSMFGGTWPPSELQMGGFFIDKYPCSHPAATPTARGIGDAPIVLAGSTDDIAQSRPGVVAWTNIDLVHAGLACENRTFNGVKCHLARPWEWAAVLLLMQSNPSLRGNNFQNRDIRDPDQWEYEGVSDPNDVDRCLVGTGPASWAHNGAPDGVFEMIGSIPEMVDMDVQNNRFIHLIPARLGDPGGILAADVTMVIDQVTRIEHWPAEDGLCVIRAEGANTQEYVRYATLVDNLDGTYTLTGLTRAQRGTAASDHGFGAKVELRADYCLVPGGHSVYVNDNGLDNDSDETSVVQLRELVSGPGAGAFGIGNVLIHEAEKMLIIASAEAGGIYTVSVTRGYDGTAKVAHAESVPLATISPDLAEGLGYWDQAGWPQGLRTELHLLDMALPGISTPDYQEGVSLDDAVMISFTWTGVVMRGGYSVSPLAPDGYSGFHMSTVPDDGLHTLGFRAAFTVE